ncbi:MAG: Gfo/Idh/MocA family oxidoreductase [Verrucomicrobiia bacterium]
MEQIKYGIIGCGLIGEKRAKSLSRASLAACCDVNLQSAQKLASTFNIPVVTQSIEEILALKELQAVIIATPNHLLAPLTLEAIRARKHVLVEKPGALKSHELELALTEMQHNNVKVRVGFNHRYHPALQKAHEIFQTGALGPLMFIRARYGHGGRIGYEKEWRANPKLSGGGELIDQGVHLIDLAHWFLGDFLQIEGQAATYFWDMPVDDNAFLNLRIASGQTAWLQVSCTEWKNLFLEIYGRNAKLHIEGLGGSYGIEKLSYYKMLPQMGPPETTIWEYPQGDQSWNLEMKEFEKDIRENRKCQPGLNDALTTLKIVETIYQKSGYKH